MASQYSGLARAAWGGEEREGIRAPNRAERHGSVGVSMDLSFGQYLNTPTPCGGPPQDAHTGAWMYAAAPAGGRLVPPLHARVDGQARHDEGEWPSEDLRRTIDDVDSGRIETADYPSAKEYLEHLHAVLDE